MSAHTTWPAVRALDLVKVHGEGSTAVRALDRVNLDLPAGRLTAIMGPSGSGKSTLLHCLAGLDTPTSGTVLLGEVELGRLGDTALTRVRRERLGFVFQAFNLVPTLTARENILLPSRLAGTAPEPAWLDLVIEAVGLADRLGHRPAQLSGGQQQRVAVARALAGRPEVIFADEPTGNLDSRAGHGVLGLLRESVDTLGQTVVMVTHDPRAAEWADAAVVLADGRVADRIEQPTATAVLDRLGRLGELTVLALALTSAWQRKRRLAGTLSAVALGVAFLAATLVVGASARAGFRDTFVTANAGVDAYVRSAQQLTGGVENTRPPLPAAIVAEVAGVDGVAAARPVVQGTAQVAGPDGRPLDGGRPALAAEAWVDVPELTGWRLAEGHAPRTAGEVVVDRALAREAGLTVGDEVVVLVPAPVEATVVGVARFGEEDTTAGANLVAFTAPEAQRLLLGSRDLVSAVVVAGEDGVTEPELAGRIARVLPEGAEAVTGATLTAEQQAEVEGDLVDALTLGLLAFAFVALVVAAFGIVNTFAILAAQRVRESALLRAIGASRRQVLSAALVEAAVVGLAGSALGVALGVVLASGLLAATASIGFPLPVDGLVLAPGDAATALAVGVAVTVAGALPAAWRASRVPPVAALREAALGDAPPSRRRVAAGLAALAGGALGVLLAGGGSLGAAALGSVLLLGGMVLLGPAAVRGSVSALGGRRVARRVERELAVRNAARNPRRSAATASALLVGVGVVSLFTVFGASAARSVDEAVSRSFAGDLALTPATDGGGLPPDLVDSVARLPEVETAAGVGRGPAVLAGRQDDLAFADLAALPAVLDVDVADGDLDAAAEGGLAASTEYAADRGWQVGDTVDVGFPDGTSAPLELAATYEHEAVVGTAVVDRAVWAAHASQPRFDVVAVSLAEGVGEDEGRAALEAATAGPGAPQVRDRDGFVAAEVSQVSGVLNVVYALLAVAIVIALTGIANTLSLSIHERGRELGLLRAVGQTRRQLRAMVRYESMLVAAFGAAGGVGLGAFLGWGVVRALDARADIATFALPLLPLAGVLAAGVLVGVVAGIVPAWRASRVPVLDAIGDR